MITLYRNYWKEKNSNNSSIYACGWADYNGNILSTGMIIDVVSDYLEAKLDLCKLPELLNGNFSIIISDKQKTYLISDRMRSFPLVYFFEHDRLIVTDDLFQYKKNNKNSFQIDEILCEQILCSNYIIGPYTLFKDIYSTQSGEIVLINHETKSIDKSQYYRWIPKMQNDEFKRDYKEEAEQQEKIFISVFNRMIKSAPKVNNWVIPLSGGYDSRVVVNYLYKLGVKNVICFTYGMESNIQSEISRQVAEALGYEWHFIDYKIWLEKMKSLNIKDAYLEYAFNGSSVPHLQDFPAVYALKEMGVIHVNDIFVPGHALDFIAGSHLKIEMQSCNEVESVIPHIQKHLAGFGYYPKRRKNVFKHTKSIISRYDIAPIEMPESFNWQERQTKFIANSVKIYEYFGYSWRMPEWDVELIKYWENIGFNYRYDRNMFKEIYKKYLNIDVLQSIPYANDLTVEKKRNIKATLIDSIPFWLKKILKKKGIGTSQYYVSEGSHLIYSDNHETIAQYLLSFNVPTIVRKYLKPYAKEQKIADFDINSVTTLLNIRKSAQQL